MEAAARFMGAGRMLDRLGHGPGPRCRLGDEAAVYAGSTDFDGSSADKDSDFIGGGGSCGREPGRLFAGASRSPQETARKQMGSMWKTNREHPELN